MSVTLLLRGRSPRCGNVDTNCISLTYRDEISCTTSLPCACVYIAWVFRAKLSTSKAEQWIVRVFDHGRNKPPSSTGSRKIFHLGSDDVDFKSFSSFDG